VTELGTVEGQLGYRFSDEALLLQALTHPSLSREQGPAALNNQRLEFLGDAVLQLIITDELYSRFRLADEGSLTKARAHLVNRTALAHHGDNLGLGQALRLSRGEEATGGRGRASTLADAFEAVIGAMFLDGGLEVARRFILDQFQKALGALGTIPNLENPKGDLQEILQATGCQAPQYRLESTSGPDHDRRFVAAVHHQGEVLGRGEGRSKKLAESEAARAALAQLRTLEKHPPASPASDPSGESPDD
jgi:ribonuclease-3